MALRSFSGAAKETALTGDITAVSTSFSVVDGTGYPTGASGPFVVTLSAGLAAEEKILIASRSGNTFTVSARGYDGTSASTHGSGSSVAHTISAIDLAEANAHVNDAAAHPPAVDTSTFATLTGTQTLTNKTLTQPDIDDFTLATHTHASPATGGTLPGGASTKVIRIPHTFTISGEVAVAVGDTSFIPPFFIPEPATQAVTLVAARHRINSGTSATVKLQVNGVDATGFTGIAVSTTTATTDPTDVLLADGDQLALVVTAVSGTPKNLSFSVFLEYAV